MSHYQKEGTHYKTIIRDKDGAIWMELKVNLNTITKNFRFLAIEREFTRTKNLKKDLINFINVKIDQKKHKFFIFSMS